MLLYVIPLLHSTLGSVERIPIRHSKLFPWLLPKTMDRKINPTQSPGKMENRWPQTRNGSISAAIFRAVSGLGPFSKSHFFGIFRRAGFPLNLN